MHIHLKEIHTQTNTHSDTVNTINIHKQLKKKSCIPYN